MNNKIDAEYKKRLDALSELEELTNGVLAVPVPDEEREAVYEMTRKYIEAAKKRDRQKNSKTNP